MLIRPRFHEPLFGFCARCMQAGEKRSAARTPCQRHTGCGGRHRRLPIGGAANGIPRYSRTAPSPSRRAGDQAAFHFDGLLNPGKEG